MKEKISFIRETKLVSENKLNKKNEERFQMLMKHLEKLK